MGYYVVPCTTRLFPQHCLGPSPTSRSILWGVIIGWTRVSTSKHGVRWNHCELWILAESSTSERWDDWNHWKIFSRGAIKVEFVRSEWWWGVCDPRPYEPYWSEPDMSKEHMVYCLYLEATGDEPDRPREIFRLFGR